MSRRVLIVDDDPRLLRVIDMYLTFEGFEVLTAVNGDEALARMDTLCPDLVILDIMMAGTDGIATCASIRSHPRTAHLPVIMFSALSADHDVERARLAGANHLITKPFNLAGLGAVVRSCFAGAEVAV
jgi:two-component system cell cycle response regulator